MILVLSVLNKWMENYISFCGNHDSANRIEIYKSLPNVTEVQYATMIKYKKFNFFLCHYQVYMGNYDEQMDKVWCIHGHTHSQDKFCDIAKNYNVCLDAHNCYPVEIEDVLADIYNEWNTIYQEQAHNNLT